MERERYRKKQEDNERKKKEFEEMK